MKKRTIYIILIILFILLDLYIAFLTFLDYLAEYKTIEIYNQESNIVKEIKEHFNINYDIKKVRFKSGMPDGYYLDIYNEKNQVQSVFEDNHEDSNIFDYFKNMKPDTPKHLKYIIVEILFELIIIFIIEEIYQKKDRTYKHK